MATAKALDCPVERPNVAATSPHTCTLAYLAVGVGGAAGRLDLELFHLRGGLAGRKDVSDSRLKWIPSPLMAEPNFAGTTELENERLATGLG